MRMSINSKAFILVVFITLFISCDIITPPSDEPKPLDPILEVSIDYGVIGNGYEQHFGVILIGAESNIFNIELQNIGELDLNFSSISLVHGDSESFILNTSSASVLTEGGSSIISIAFVPNTVGEKSSTLRIESNCSLTPVFEVIVKGIGYEPKSQLAVLYDDAEIYSEGIIDLGTVVIGKPKTYEFTVLNSGDKELDFSSTPMVQLTGDMYELVSDLPNSIPAGGSATFQIELDPSEPNSYQAEIILENNSVEHQAFNFRIHCDAILELPDFVIQRNNYQFHPNQNFDFGYQDVGEYRDIDVTLHNYGKGVLSFSNTPAVQISGDSASFQVVSNIEHDIAPFGNATITLRFEPKTYGDIEASMEIESNDPENPLYVLNLKGRGYAPEIRVSRSSLVYEDGDTIGFSQTYLGDQTTYTIRISNVGNKALELSETGHVLISGSDNFSLDDNTNAVVAPGAHTFFDVHFIPSDPGSHRSNLIIESNDPNQSVFSLDIAGTARHWYDEVIINQADSLAYATVSNNQVTVSTGRASGSGSYFQTSFNAGRTWLPENTHHFFSSTRVNALRISNSELFLYNSSSTSWSGNSLVLYKSTDNGESWDEENAITIDSDGESFGRVVYHIEGSTHYLLYSATVNGSSKIKFAKSLDGGKTWSQENTHILGSTGGRGGAYSMIVDGNDVIVSYYKFTVDNNEVNIFRSTDKGDSWLPTNHQTVEIVGNYRDSYTSDTAMVMEGDRVYLFYYYARQKALKLAVSYDRGVTWDESDMQLLDDTVIEQGRDLAVCKYDGRIYVVYRDGVNTGQIKFMFSSNGTSWSKKTIDSDTDNTNPKIMAFKDVIYVLYTKSNDEVILTKADKYGTQWN
jgi:hypothetical protein